MTPDLETLSREIAATSDAVRLAIAAVKANPPRSQMPWWINGKFLEDANGEDVAWFCTNADTVCAHANIAAAPLLIAEVERLTAALEAARLAVAEWSEVGHSDVCEFETFSADDDTPGLCDCGAAANNAARIEGRRALGLEG